MTITDQALVAAANLADRYISDRFLPDKAIDLIDEAGLPAAHPAHEAPPDSRSSKTRSRRSRREKEAAIEAQRVRTGEASCATGEGAARREGRPSEARVARPRARTFDVVDEETIAEVLAAWTGIPVYQLTEEETAKLLRMEDELHKRVVGQDEAIKALSPGDPPHPCRPQGPEAPARLVHLPGPDRASGKTELAKTLAEFLFDDEDALIQLDMSEYMEKHTVSPPRRLAPGLRRLRRGRPADRGRAAQAVHRGAVRRGREGAPRRLQHPAPDPGGRPPDRRQGRTVDFKNTVLIMTSNLGDR